MSGLTGLILGWTWLTHTDSGWLLPGLALLVAGAVLMHFRQRSALISLARNVGLAAAACIAVIAGVMTANLAAYGTFAVSDANERDLTAALNALQSVEAGPIKPHVPVPAAVRNEVSKASLTFRRLNRAFGNRDFRERWSAPGCRIDRATCGDFARPWFKWALRDAAAMSGLYASPKSAAQTFAKLANEIEAACSAGKLKCRHAHAGAIRRTIDVPLASLASSAESIGKRASFITAPVPAGAQLTRKDIEPQTFERYWAFLNRPFVSTAGKMGVQTTATGWYRDVASTRWPGFAVYAKGGELVPYALERQPSPDLQRHFSDERLAWNRYSISYLCPDTCTIAALRFGQPDLRLGTDRLRSVGAASDMAILYIDQVLFDWEATADRTTVQRFAAYARTGLVPIYVLTVPLLIFAGLIALIAASDGAIASRWLNPALVVAAAAWLLVAARISMLALDEAGSLPTAALRDVAPAAYLAVVAAFLSIGAVIVQARRL